MWLYWLRKEAVHVFRMKTSDLSLQVFIPKSDTLNMLKITSVMMTLQVLRIWKRQPWLIKRDPRNQFNNLIWPPSRYFAYIHICSQSHRKWITITCLEKILRTTLKESNSLVNSLVSTLLPKHKQHFDTFSIKLASDSLSFKNLKAYYCGSWNKHWLLKLG